MKQVGSNFDQPSESPAGSLADNFPIYLADDFDFTFPGIGWTIGLRSTYPNILKKRIASAAISLMMGISAERVEKKYLHNVEYEEPPTNRLDLVIDKFIKHQIEVLDNALDQFKISTEDSFGQFVAKFTLLRTLFSLQALLSSSHKGALYESAALARLALEQIAFAHSVFHSMHLENIQHTKPQRCISALKNIPGNGGYLYGWLSEHAHWMYDAHAKAISITGDQVGIVYRSSSFKIKSMSISLSILYLLYETIVFLMGNSLRTSGVNLPPTPEMTFKKLSVDIINASDGDTDIPLLLSFTSFDS